MDTTLILSNAFLVTLIVEYALPIQIVAVARTVITHNLKAAWNVLQIVEIVILVIYASTVFLDTTCLI